MDHHGCFLGPGNVRFLNIMVPYQHSYSILVGLSIPQMDIGIMM